MKILITGVTGFVGSNLADCLTAQGYEIVGVGRRIFCESNVNKYIQCDLSKGLPFNEPVDCIIHAAAQSSYNAARIADYINGNVLATQTIARFAIEKRVKKIIYLSSISVYGDITLSVVDEQTPIINPDAYGMTKYMGEKIFEEIADRVPCLVLRLPGILGRGAHSCWLAKTIQQAREGTDIMITNVTGLFNNVVSCNDLASFIRLLIEISFQGFDVVTLGVASSLTIQEIVTRCIMGYQSQSRVIEKGNSRTSFTISSKKAQEMYGFSGSRIENIIDTYITEERA